MKEIDENITEIDLDDGFDWDFVLKNEESDKEFLLNVTYDSDYSIVKEFILK